LALTLRSLNNVLKTNLKYKDMRTREEVIKHAKGHYGEIFIEDSTRALGHILEVLLDIREQLSSLIGKE